MKTKIENIRVGDKVIDTWWGFQTSPPGEVVKVTPSEVYVSYIDDDEVVRYDKINTESFLIIVEENK